MARAATATAATVISSQAGYRAPRLTAASPATTPPPPRMAAAHRPSVTSSFGRCSGSSTGSGPDGRGITGTGRLYRAAETTIMMRIELPMPAAASQPRDTSPGDIPAGCRWPPPTADISRCGTQQGGVRTWPGPAGSTRTLPPSTIRGVNRDDDYAGHREQLVSYSNRL